MTRPTNPTTVEVLRQLPNVHELLALPALKKTQSEIGRGPVRDAVQTCLESWRERILSGTAANGPPRLEHLTEQILKSLSRQRQMQIRRVINATGILLHTGFGRAPLADSAVKAAVQAAGYCNLEIGLESGERTRRHAAVDADLCALTGAEAAFVVNNNAGATGLVLAALSGNREAIVSHGQLVEIGGGFRLPDVIRAYGATLRAVGTTNRTSLQDYESAINERTGAIMVVHTSNYRIVGFAEQPSLREIAHLGKNYNVPVIHDVGSGALIHLSTDIQQDEPVVRDSIAQGSDLVLFSGDKLLGGPQAGIIVGKRHIIEELVSHPISRALRIDKLRLAALQATLKIYRQGETDPAAYDTIPFLKLLQTKLADLEERARSLAARLTQKSKNWTVEAQTSVAYCGGGSMPGNTVESWAVCLEAKQPSGNVEKLAQRLRSAEPAIMGRVHRGKLYLDLRGVVSKDDETLFSVVVGLTQV